jgi:hypothetical protein
LAAVHALARFIGAHSPEHIAWCGAIRDIVSKKAPQPVIAYLEKDEMDALLAAPDQMTSQGQRDVNIRLTHNAHQKKRDFPKKTGITMAYGKYTATTYLRL